MSDDLLNGDPNAQAGADPNTTEGAPAARRGRPPKPKPENVTYRPGEQDPPSVKWRGRTFHANVPVWIDDADFIEAARNNRHFFVGEFDQDKHGVPTVEQPSRPKTSEQYRVHFVNWLRTVTSVDELDTKWQAEETLRLACEVGSDDIDYMMTLFGPKRAELRKRDIPL